MKLYKMVIDDDSRLPKMVEFFGVNEYDSKNAPETNLYDAMHSHTADQESVCDYVADIKSGKIEVRKCSVCGKYFFLTDSEAKWFTERKLSKPKRCPECRHHKKMSRNEH